ncbi:IclR family transcriptional regulator [Phytoactinopolyspora mesophila]|uniref:Helix-turn-helix domain-containing protein n=1 Tax=Phytoactinopolyspora mesophila TaxID=2650750 RepID=A0A7K3LZM1_9ACTN|nr:IclR family transcriptional regulator [Phytoactinopolyspora mesophila]NDL56493.1 helix-turn-helix domain-containing protein [Phytoactinopolyspora mesophila]
MDSGSTHESPKPTAAGRLLALLGAFSDGNGALRLSELSRRADLSLTTAHRLVQELLGWGGLEVDQDGRYRLSAKFIELASVSTQGLRLRETALPYLVDLQRRTGLTVHLAVRNGLNVMNLEALRLHPNYGGANRIGGSLRLHVGATGLVLLAYAPPGFVDLYVREPLLRFTSQTIGDVPTLLKTLEQTRADGHVIARNTPVGDKGMIAAPVMNAEGGIEAAVGMICSLDRHDPDRYVGIVRAMARRISRALAARAPQPSARTLAFRSRHAAAS